LNYKYRASIFFLGLHNRNDRYSFPSDSPSRTNNLYYCGWATDTPAVLKHPPTTFSLSPTTAQQKLRIRRPTLVKAPTLHVQPPRGWKLNWKWSC